jgi:hypothetical protein
MRHPSEFFIKYLLTLPRAESQNDDWIKMNVQALGFPHPDDMYISQMRERLYANLPVNYDPTDRYNRPSVKFLRSEGIWSLHNPDEAVRTATSILPNFRVRKLIEQLLLGRIEPKEVAKKVNARVGEHYTTDSIQAYSHYYWNCALLKTSEWVSFFEEYDKTEQSKAMAILHNGPAMALYTTGFRQNLESKQMLKDMMESMYFDFRDWEAQPRSSEKTRALTALAKAASQADQRLSEADNALRDSLKAFEQFRMKHEQQKVKGIEELAPAGNFSDSGSSFRELPPGPNEKKAD